MDYGTRDYHYGTFFDQREDEQLLLTMREYEMQGVVPDDADIDHLKALMRQKLVLKDRMMHDLRINQQCASAMKNLCEPAAFDDNQKNGEKRQQILCAGASKKIAHELEQKMHPRPITLPRRQDEYGKWVDDYDLLSLSQMHPKSPAAIGKLFTGLELIALFPLVLSWIGRHIRHQEAVAMVFDILQENPDVVGAFGSV